MFPLSCAQTGYEMSALKKTWSAHKWFFRKCFCTLFFTLHSTYRLIAVKCCTKEILCGHSLYKIRGNIGDLDLSLQGEVKYKHSENFSLCIHNLLVLGRFTLHITRQSRKNPV